MTLLRIIEGPFEDDRIIHDTELVVAPRVGETLRLRWPDRSENLFRVLAVEHLYDVRETVAVSRETTAVRVSVEAI